MWCHHKSNKNGFHIIYTYLDVKHFRKNTSYVIGISGVETITAFANFVAVAASTDIASISNSTPNLSFLVSLLHLLLLFSLLFLQFLFLILSLILLLSPFFSVSDSSSVDAWYASDIVNNITTFTAAVSVVVYVSNFVAVSTAVVDAYSDVSDLPLLLIFLM